MFAIVCGDAPRARRVDGTSRRSKPADLVRLVVGDDLPAPSIAGRCPGRSFSMSVD